MELLAVHAPRPLGRGESGCSQRCTSGRRGALSRRGNLLWVVGFLGHYSWRNGDFVNKQ
jgi:hypothetical protein